VLTVEDDPIVRADLRLILEDAGFDVHGARNGYEALEATRDHRPHLILLDLGLPHLDGFEATRRILRERDVPIVAVTGRGEEAISEAVEAGAVAWIRKPFDDAQLVDMVRSVLEQRGELADTWEHAHLMVMIEGMAREGYSDWEITNAVDRALGESRRGRMLASFRRRLGREATS
jgi:DNA-binding response OmpR family regulator